MINEIDTLMTQAIGLMEIDNATGIQSEIEMGNGDRYSYEIRKLEKD